MSSTSFKRFAGMSTPLFHRTVWAHYKKHGRHDLAWRKTRDPYKILVSEIMLQQTTVKRVLPFYERFLKKFPNVKTLARVPLSRVIKEWQGLGYNRRAKMLHLAAKEMVEKYNGQFPKEITELERLPGIGPYTARAVAAFAYNQDCIFIETNIRTVILHHFFQPRKGMIYHTFDQKVADKGITTILKKVLPKGKAREWYAALMDYGAYLKQSGVRLNTQSKHYTRQSRFAGSNREARGAILRELSKGSRSKARLLQILGRDRALQLEAALSALLSESLVRKNRHVYSLPR